MLTLRQRILVFIRDVYVWSRNINKYPEHINWTPYIESGRIPEGLCFDPQGASDMIAELLQKDEPCMIARFGSTEMNAVQNVLNTRTSKGALDYILHGGENWITDYTRESMTKYSGFFPSTDENLIRFADMILRDIREIDILGSWLVCEDRFGRELECPRVPLIFLEPFWADRPWTAALRGKRVVVVHPFAKSIRYQYEHRDGLFANPDMLPEFGSFDVIEAVQSLGGSCRFANWFDALEYMENELDRLDYDVALIGCGAYGLPLAAHVKRSGRKAVHVGGALQLMFGIVGQRWTNPAYARRMRSKWPHINYLNLFNEKWIRPGEEEKPKTASSVEGACYW